MDVHAVTLRQNPHQFYEGENARNAVSDKAFSRVRPQYHPLECAKTLKVILMAIYRLPFDDDGDWQLVPQGNWDDPATE